MKLWPHGFWVGLIGSDFSDHKIWAIMLLAVIARGPGKLSIDRLIQRFWPGARSQPKPHPLPHSAGISRS